MGYLILIKPSSRCSPDAWMRFVGLRGMKPLREPRQHSGWDAILDRKRNVGFAEGNPCTSPQWGHSTFNVSFQPGLAVWVGLDTRMCGGWLL